MSDTFDPRASYAPGLFAGKTAVVTGGGRGIGKAIAVGFAQLGANVVIASNAPEELETAAPDIEALGVECLPVEVNIRDVASVEAFRDTTVERFGAADYLVNNAGGQFQAHPLDISDNGWRAVIDLNLNGTWNVCSRFMRHMMERGEGSIVNLAHVFSFERGAPMFAHSGAARAGVVNLTRTMAIYLADKDITCNALAPGSIDTEGWHEKEIANMGGDAEAIIQSILDDCPARRYATADEVAAQIVFLCSPAARYITGQALVADGGLVLANWNTNISPGMAW